MASSYRRIDAVVKTCEILKYLASQKTAATGPDISRAVNLPVATVMCHLVTLADQGLVQQVGDGWLLGMGLALMWARVKSNLESTIERNRRDLDSITITGGN